MRKLIAIVLIVGVLVSVLACSAPEPAPTVTTTATATATQTVVAKTYDLKLHTFIPEPVLPVSGFIKPFIAKVNERSEGLIRITPYYVNALVPALELTAATSEGTIDMALNTAGYDRGVVPQSLTASNLPYGFESPEQAEYFWKEYEGGQATKLMQQAYAAKGVLWGPYLSALDPITFMTKTPINTAADIKGLKIRASGAYAGFLTTMGAAHVNIGMGEVYSAMEKGVVDGTFAATTALDDFKYKEVVKYYMQPAAQFSGAFNFQMNLKLYNEMDPELQKIIWDTANEISLESLLPMSKEATEKALANAAAVGVKTTTISEAEVAKLRVGFESEWKAADEASPEIMKLMKAYLDSQGINYPGK